MGFYVQQNKEEDELRALFGQSLSNGSGASGGNHLNYGGSFLRMTHS
jgi:hypothetical protein